ncbi:hypothetical protein FRB95_012466 [Tulasnella sp. JGI-2019a]|nr:hypothetical protein FRB95_012466 [Tulasnella sp. JGI-2019a]
MATIQASASEANGLVDTSPVGLDEVQQNGDQVDGADVPQDGDAAPVSNGSVDPSTATNDVEENAGDKSPIKPKAAVSDDAKLRSSKPMDANGKAGTKPAAKPALVSKILSSGKFGLQNKGQPAKPVAEATNASAKPPLSPTKSKSTPTSPIAPALMDSPGAASITTDGDVSTPIEPTTVPAPAPEPAPTPTPAPVLSPTKSGIPASSKSAKPGNPGAAPPRRTSMAPPGAAAKPLVKPGPPPSASSTAKVAPPRTSIAGGPRASISGSNLSRNTTNALRKSVVSPTPSTSSVKSGPISKPSTATGIEKKAVPPRSGMTASISRTSAIRPTPSKQGSTLIEVKEDKKGDAELEQKYNEAVTELAAKSGQITSLETELETLRSGLDQRIAEINERTAELEELRESVNTASETQKGLDDEIKRLQGVTDSLEAEHQKKFSTAESDLSAARADLEAAVKSAQSHKESHAALEAELLRVQDELKTLSTSRDNDTTSAEVEHAALLQAQADLRAIKVETDSVTAGHAMAISKHEQTIAGLKSHVSVAEKSIEALRLEVDDLKREREEMSQKLSELEVEILEMQEAQEKAQDEREKEIASIKADHETEKEETRKALEQELAKATEAHQHAAKMWEEATVAAGEKHSETMAVAVKKAEAAATAASEEAQKALAESQAEALWEKEVEWLKKTEGLENRIKELEEEIKAEESRIEAQVAIVRNEHDEKLKKAFDDAKIEAGEAHSVELGALRAQSKATLEQVKAAHQSEIDSITATHEEALNSQVKSLEKQISSLKLELSATQDDLTKAKAALSASKSETDSLKAQVDQAAIEAQIARASSGAEKDTAIADLAKQLANTQQEMNDLNEAFKMTQSGFVDELSQVKQNHQRELEEASKGRVLALDELQKTHDEALGKIKADLAHVKTELDDQREEAQRAVSEAAALKARSPPATPNAKAQTNGVVSKDDLAKLHQAHQAKVAELESEGERRMKEVTAQNDALLRSLAEMQASLEHKEMERSMYETDANETQEEITALKAELERLRPAA